MHRKCYPRDGGVFQWKIKINRAPQRMGRRRQMELRRGCGDTGGMHLFYQFITMAGAVTGMLLLGAGVLHLIPKLGDGGRRLSAALCHAPGLDVLVTYFTVAPLFAGPIVYGWAGFLGAVVGQVAGVLLWTVLHELAHRDAVRGPRIVKVINRLIGRWRNHTAIWLTAIVTPMFWIVRMAEVFVYPPIQWLTGFPSYRSGDWVNVSRHKFSGLVGHDLIWCLYCDWMTGIWSLGTEMLRNVESFWCPIRFSDSAKCENCSVDFPDVKNGWVGADADMAQVTGVLEQMHGGGDHGWFGHPVRLTVKGKISEKSAPVGKGASA